MSLYQSFFSPASPRTFSPKFGTLRRLFGTFLIPTYLRDLADINKDGKLTKDGFAVAMHLINGKLAGKVIPTTLPESLIPPSMRTPAASTYHPPAAQIHRDLLIDDNSPPGSPETASRSLYSPPVLQPQGTGILQPQSSGSFSPPRPVAGSGILQPQSTGLMQQQSTGAMSPPRPAAGFPAPPIPARPTASSQAPAPPQRNFGLSH
jgi:epidermal growth factor receptor substrate 15